MLNPLQFFHLAYYQEKKNICIKSLAQITCHLVLLHALFQTSCTDLHSAFQNVFISLACILVFLCPHMPGIFSLSPSSKVIFFFFEEKGIRVGPQLVVFRNHSLSGWGGSIEILCCTRTELIAATEQGKCLHSYTISPVG